MARYKSREKVFKEVNCSSIITMALIISIGNDLFDRYDENVLAREETY